VLGGVGGGGGCSRVVPHLVFIGWLLSVAMGCSDLLEHWSFSVRVGQKGRLVGMDPG